MHKISNLALVAALAIALPGCYTELRTTPPPEPQMQPEPEFSQPPPAPESIDGDYTGTILLSDETGHATARVRMTFAEGRYRAEVENLPVLEGEFQLGDTEVILVEHGTREGMHDWRLAPSGHFEIHRSDEGISLVQRLRGRGYREVLLTPESASE